MPLQLSSPEPLRRFLARLGERHPHPAKVYLFGGSALLFLGSQRNTADVDFTLSAAHADTLRQNINEIAVELDLDLEESVPADFIPLPADADQRHQLIGTFGNIEAYLFDPYSIAVMKIDRAFEIDMDDVHLLIQLGHVDLDFLEQCIEDVARRYDEPIRLRRNFAEMKRGLAK